MKTDHSHIKYLLQDLQQKKKKACEVDVNQSSTINKNCLQEYKRTVKINKVNQEL